VVTVKIDKTAPTITAPLDVATAALLATSSTAVVLDAQLAVADASDNLGSVTVARSGVPTGNAFAIGTTTITYTATDPAGNSTDALQRVVVKPATPTLTARATTPATEVLVRGQAVAGAAVAILGGTEQTASTADASGDYAVSVPIALGANALTATQTINGQTSAASTPASVRRLVPVVASPATPAGVEGAPMTGLVATFVADAADTYTASIDWGDGAHSSGTVAVSGAGSFKAAGTHTYREEGDYRVEVTIVDDVDATNSGVAHSRASVADAPLHASAPTLSPSAASFDGTVATFVDESPYGTVADFTATIDWGDGATSTGTVTAGSGGGFKVSGTHTYGGTGYRTIATAIVDDGGSRATTSAELLVYAFPGNGTFVVGDRSATGSVLFWGGQWWKRNSLSGGTGPPSFKGFALTADTSACTPGWKTLPAKNPPPPAPPLPTYMAVVVAASVDSNGAASTGGRPHVVVVRTDTGYNPTSGAAGTGTVVATVC
jgi:hypothetical protein